MSTKNLENENLENDLVQRWLTYAKSDLELARVSLPESVLLETLCYHSQQSAEKALKALLIAYSGDPPRTHNIGTLLDLLAKHIDIPEEIRESAILTEYAVSTRYPGFVEPVEIDDYEFALALADRVFLWSSQIVESKV
jgi:HEPN domain-containing protein